MKRQTERERRGPSKRDQLGDDFRDGRASPAMEAFLARRLKAAELRKRLEEGKPPPPGRLVRCPICGGMRLDFGGPHGRYVGPLSPDGRPTQWDCAGPL